MQSVKKSWNEIVMLLKAETHKSLTKQISGLIMTSKELEDTSDQAFITFFTKRCAPHTHTHNRHTADTHQTHPYDTPHSPLTTYTQYDYKRRVRG